MSTPFTDEQLTDLIGAVAVNEYRNVPEYAKAELDEWIAKLRERDDDEFYSECRRWIYEDALVSNSRRNWNHVYCRGSACHYESRRRQVLAGHSEDCCGPSIYSRAHAAVMQDHGYEPRSSGVCECEGVTKAVT